MAVYPSMVITKDVALAGVLEVNLLAVVQVIVVLEAIVGEIQGIPSMTTVTVPLIALLSVTVTAVPPVI
jgi:hypothetical protein